MNNRVSVTAGLSKETRGQVSKLKKLLLANDADAVRQGIEIARALGDVRVFDYFLEGVTYDGLRIAPARKFVSSSTSWKYLNYTILGLISHAPEECVSAVEIRKRVKVLRVEAAGLEDMSVFENLRGLDLSGGEILEDLDGLAGCFGLECVKLTGCVSLKNVDGLKGKKKLREFIYCPGAYKDFTSSLENIDGLSGCVSLRKVVIDSAENIPDLDGMNECIELKELDISSCGSLKNLDGLKRLNKLTELKTRSTTSLENINGLEGCKELKKVSFTWSKRLKNIDGLRGCTGLRKVEFKHCNSLDNIKGLEDMTELEEVVFDSCGSLKDLSALASCPNIIKVGLSFCNSLENIDGLKRCTNLKEIDISWCGSLKSIKGLSNAVNINELDLESCYSLKTLEGIENLQGLTLVRLDDCKSLESIDILAGLRNLRELKMEGCTGVKIPPGPVNMKLKKEVEKYQDSLFKSAGKPVPEHLKKSIQNRKEREAGIYDTFTRIKKLFRQRSFYHVKQGLELARSSGDPALFECLLEGISYTHLGKNENYGHNVRGVYYIPMSNDFDYIVGKIEGNKVFEGTKADYPYFMQAFLGLIAYAPPGCKTAEQLKNEIKSLLVILS